ncbi:MAG: PAS domain-containing protein [Bacteroidota bacterium]|nr:PAS domain-containing protein [Bacteroidota bacterium]
MEDRKDNLVRSRSAIPRVNSEELLVLNEALENYFANTIIPQLFVDADLILRKFTPQAMRQFSLTAADIGSHIKDVQEHIRHQTLIESINEVIKTGEILEKEIQTDDKRWFQMNILPYVERRKGTTNGVIITFVDITARLAALKELEKLNTDHNTLLFALSHDIRQPLSTVQLVTDELLIAFDENDTQQYNKWVETLKRASRTMKELVNDFTEHIRMQDEKPAEDERLSISNIFEDVILSLREEIHQYKVQVQSHFDVLEIIFHRKGMRSIVYNLLSNALKYRKADVPLQIIASTKKENDQIILTISDNGIGIAPENQPMIFEKYTRINREIQGTGMGLYIITRMLEARGDRIELQSVPGEGSTFKVYLGIKD